MSSGKGENLIFLISQPRSGSTLTQRILMNHFAVHSVPEPWIMLPLCYTMREKGHSAEYDEKWASVALRDFLNQCPNKNEDYLEAIRRMSTFLYGRVMSGSGARYFVDKTPRYYNIISELYEVFPKARFIILLRNPIAIFASIYNTWIVDRIQHLANFKRDLIDAPKLLLDGIHHLGARAYVVRYEELVNDPEQSFSEMFSWLDLKFEKEILNYHETTPPAGVSGDPTGVNQHSKPVNGSVDRWRGIGEDPQLRRLAIEYVNALGAKTISGLGYEYDEIVKILEASYHPNTGTTLSLAQVLTHSKNWNRTDWLTYWKVCEIKEHGAWSGNMRFLRKRYRTVVREKLQFLFH